jgi:hypothetical protein
MFTMYKSAYTSQNHPRSSQPGGANCAPNAGAYANAGSFFGGGGAQGAAGGAPGFWSGRAHKHTQTHVHTLSGSRTDARSNTRTYAQRTHIHTRIPFMRRSTGRWRDGNISHLAALSLPSCHLLAVLSLFFHSPLNACLLPNALTVQPFLAHPHVPLRVTSWVDGVVTTNLVVVAMVA